MNDPASIALTLTLTMLAGIWLGRYTKAVQQPDIHVHLPEDAARLPGMPEGALLDGDNKRMALYWHVYKEASWNDEAYPEDHAREAVEAVFGRVP